MAESRTSSVFHSKTEGDEGKELNQIQVMLPGMLREFGNRHNFSGRIATVRCSEHNTAMKQMLMTPGQGRVLVVDAGGSRRCAFVGDQCAGLAIRNGWQAIILNGCLRDIAEVATMPIGVRALGVSPIRCGRGEGGERNVVVNFCGLTFKPGAWCYADQDGMIVSEIELKTKPKPKPKPKPNNNNNEIEK